MTYKGVLLTAVFLILFSLDGLLPPHSGGLVQAKRGSLSTQRRLPGRASGDREAAFLHLLHGQWASGLLVSEKLFAEETYSMEINCLNDTKKTSDSWPMCSKHPFLVKTLIQLELKEDLEELVFEQQTFIPSYFTQDRLSLWKKPTCSVQLHPCPGHADLQLGVLTHNEK